MIREARNAVYGLIRKLRGPNGYPRAADQPALIPEDVKREIDAEGDEVRRELVRLQGRMLSLAEEYRQGDMHA